VTGGASAGFGRRLAALIYDSLLLAALLFAYTAIVVAVRGGGLTAASGYGWALYRGGELALVASYYVVNWMQSGQTLGMRAWGLRTVEKSGRRLRLAVALWRCVCALVAWAPAALGVLWLYADPGHLALHDRLSGTRVLRSTRS
jgi:uncharacterized RDD family membrane protein YckC